MSKDVELVRRNPHNGKWYVLGSIGNNQFMPISEGYETKHEAEARRIHLRKAQAAAKQELQGWGGTYDA
jgi:uncharacterized protein YegP (UPF0339 family)